MAATYTETGISFLSAGLTCSGRFYLPLGAVPPFPCVVLAHGFSGTMDWILPDFASRFAGAGLAVLAFDYRHLGQSEGSPRQIVDVQEQRKDLRNAVEFVRKRPDIDPRRIGLWGTSLGGSHVVSLAAEDPGIAAVVANMPALDVVIGANISAKIKKQGGTTMQFASTTLKLFAAALFDRTRALLGLSPYYLAVYGPAGRAFFTDPALADRFAAVEKNSPTWENRVAARFLLQAPRYTPGTIARIAAPILFSLASRDLEVSADFIKEVAKASPRSQVKEYDADHFDLYHGAIFEQVVADQTAFLTEHLRV
jgi:dienelactone hydrolase